MLHRLRASMRFPAGHWGPQWCHDQMAVRYQQAVHIRPGEAAEESPFNVVDGDLFRCDLPLADEAAARDAFATLSDHNVLGQTVPMVDLDTSTPSFVEVHTCDHADDVRAGCVVVAREVNGGD